MENQVMKIEDVERTAKIMAVSKLFNKDQNQLAALMLISMAEGKPLATAALEYDIINGKPCLNSRAAQSRFQQAGGSIKWIESNSKTCIAEFTHPQGGTLKITWDIKRADLAGLTGKAVWKQYPDQMLRARCVAEGVRAVYPACLSQLYLSEEMQTIDITHEDVTDITHKNVIQLAEVDYTTVLNNCQSLDELKNVWATIPQAEANNYKELKEILKTKLK